jgi:adenylate cyclase
MAEKKSDFKSKFLAISGIVILSVMMAMVLGYMDSFQTLELRLLDLRFTLRGPQEVEDSPIVIVAIDDQSDESTPHRWPWPRSYFAHVVENLEEAGAAAIGIDVIFDQADKYGEEYDDEFAAVLKKYDNIVLAGKILKTFDGNKIISTIIPPYEKFITNSAWGMVALTADIDGFYRSYLFGQSYHDSLYPSFAAQILKQYIPELKNSELTSDDEFYYLGNLNIPKNNPLSMLINFKGQAFSMPYYPFDNILDDEDFDLLEDFDMDIFSDSGDVELEIEPGLKYSGKLKNKIVLIGATMQELHDNFPTPFLEFRSQDGDLVKAEMPGVEIHANALLTVLEKNYLQQLPGKFNFIILLLLAIFVFFITQYQHTGWAAVSAIVLALLYFVISIILFVNNHIVLQMAAPLFVVLFSFIGYTLYQFLMTQKEKKMLRGAFAYYVPEKVVQEIIANPEKLALGGEEREITVIFTDVEGFTSISENLTPAELVLLLNEYLTAMTDIVLKNDGIIDKYEGDAIMAEYGMPVHYKDHAVKACETALEMQEELSRLRKKWAAEGKPQLKARVGINTGEVIVGNMGSNTVFDYTVMGDAVNLGSRLEGANKVYKTYIMISEFTYEHVKDYFYTRPLDLIRVKGKSQPIAVYELRGKKDKPMSQADIDFCELYNKGIEAYKNQNWDDGIDHFESCIKLKPNDYPAELYRSRCIDYKFKGPGVDWDGVMTLTEK